MTTEQLHAQPLQILVICLAAKDLTLPSGARTVQKWGCYSMPVMASRVVLIGDNEGCHAACLEPSNMQPGCMTAKPMGGSVCARAEQRVGEEGVVVVQQAAQHVLLRVHDQQAEGLVPARVLLVVQDARVQAAVAPDEQAARSRNNRPDIIQPV